MNAPLNVDMIGKVAVVTGATTGVGREIARGLARMGADVVIAARSLERGEAARDDIRASTGNRRVGVLALDVSEPSSIREFAAQFKRRVGRLNVLVNNAGSWTTVRRENSEGHEITFATNALGPYLLTSLLSDTLRSSTRARVVNVVSNLASYYDPTDLDYERRKYDGFKAYGQSKQALRMLTWGQAARFAGTGVTANAVAPGFVRTELNRDAKGMMAAFINASARLFALTPAQGADTPLWVAVAPELEGVSCKYFDARKEKDGKFHDAGPIADLERRCDAMVAGSTVASDLAQAS